jgi:DNA invertase Pin-like site-specific DNA recombinase
MKAIGYIRVSTEEQSREGVSLDMQVTKIRAYCDLNDMDLVGIYGDPGISAKSIKTRPGLLTVLHLVKARKIDAVVVFKLDRLARNTIEALEMAQIMDRAGCALHSISEKLDTQNALGRFFFTLTASLAEMERNVIAERTTAALAHKKANGEKLGGECPYGFTCVDGKLLPDVTEQRTIRRIEELKASGHSSREIAKALTKEGLLTRKGTRWTHTQILRIIKRAA